MQGFVLLIRTCVSCPEEKILAEAENLSGAFIRTLPEIRTLLATDAEAAFNGDPAAQNINEVIFAIPVSGLSATIALRTSYTGWAFLLFPA